jgi:predicted enzyme related to lactoylglutathione lyase
MDSLSFVNVFVRDVEALPDFYAAVFDLPEEAAYRSPSFRALRTGASAIGFNGPEAYALLGLEPDTGAGGVRFALTFDVAGADDVGARADKAVALGARLVKGPYATAYGMVQAVLLDPEGNAFRINAAS